MKISEIKAEVEDDRRLCGRVRQLDSRLQARVLEDKRSSVCELSQESLSALQLVRWRCVADGQHLAEQTKGLKTIADVLARDRKCLDVLNGVRK